MSESQTVTAEAAPTQSPPAVKRVVSVDALRGFDMFWIIGAGWLVQPLQSIDSNPLTRTLARQLEHVQWEGFRFYDLIFPLFVFIVGVSLVFSLSRLIEREGRAAALRRIVRRSVLLYLLGVLYYGGFSTPIEEIRLLGVLQRIALCYFFTGLAFCFLPTRGLAGLCVVLLVGYWALLTFVPVPNFGAANFAEGRNLTNYLDQQYLPLRKWDGDHDPEGLLSTLPAIASCLLGVFAGLLLKDNSIEPTKKVAYLLAGGACGILLGQMWGLQFPIIKKIWTSSYVLLVGGWSAVLLSVFYLLIDVCNYRAWAQPFVWIGSNAITIYILHQVIDFEKLAARLMGGDIQTFLNGLARGLGNLCVALVAIGLTLCVVWFLYRRKVFLRL